MQRKSVWGQLWRILEPLAVKTVVEIAVAVMIGSVAGQRTEFQKYATEISAVSALAVIPVLVWMFRKDRRQEKAANDKKIPLWKYSMVLGISLPFALGLNNLLAITKLTEISAGYQEASEILYTPSFPVQIICLGVIVPIMEELIFRGLIFRRMREEMSMVRAVLYSSLLFGLYHENVVQAVYGTLCGALFAYLYEKYHSFKAPLLAHMAMNIFICTITEMNGFSMMAEQPIRMGLMTVGCVAAAVGMSVLICKKVN